MASDNAAQITFWNGPVAGRWITFREASDRRLAPMTAAVMSFAAAKRGESVIDIGCGCGETTLALAKAVGSGPEVLGVDVSEPMLDVARQLARSAGAPIQFLAADAARHPFNGTFDLAFSRFGVMFFEDPAAAFANIRTALKPSGRLAFLCWRKPAENPWATFPFDVARDLLPPQEPSNPLAPGPFAFADPERVEGILRAAGFADIRVEKLDTRMSMGDSLEQAIALATNFGPLARPFQEADSQKQSAIRARLAVEFGKRMTPGGLAFPAACWLVGARAAVTA